MSARLLIGDVFERLARLPDGLFDLILTSPPFLALRSYLPDGHPAKDREIGSEATPAAYLDVLLELTAEWGRVLAPHGSLAVELGDTYAGSGGAGGDYNPDGIRGGQPKFRQGSSQSRGTGPKAGDDDIDMRPAPLYGAGWPLDKSLVGVPQLYQLSLAYGRNLLTGEESPAGMWRIRTLKPWIRTNPPVGALGDKERPATSYVIVATRERDRWFDLDAVRTGHSEPGAARQLGGRKSPNGGNWTRDDASGRNPAGAPPRDWWHHVDAVLDACLDDMAGKRNVGPTTVSVSSASRGISGGDSGHAGKQRESGSVTQGTRGHHLRRALERAGIIRTLDAMDISPKGCKGRHYAVFPPELCAQLIEEMCPRRVCASCGQPSRRITDVTGLVDRDGNQVEPEVWRSGIADGKAAHSYKKTSGTTTTTTSGWSSCGCPGTDGLRLDGYHTGTGWRPGHVLDPFVGSGTTLQVAHGHGRDSIGIDLDSRNAELARGRLGMFLTVEQPVPHTTTGEGA